MLLKSIIQYLLIFTIVHAHENQSSTFLWGTYRPNLYFGMRTRHPLGLMTGLLWYAADNYQSWQNMRHDCQMGDNMRYNWLLHDGRSFGHESIDDPTNGLHLDIKFLKSHSNLEGGDWVVQMDFNRLNEDEQRIVSTLFYVVSNDPEAEEPFKTPKRIGNDVFFTGTSEEIGKFAVVILPKPEEEESMKLQVISMQSEAHTQWQIKDIMTNAIRTVLQQFIEQNREKVENPPHPTELLELPGGLQMEGNHVTHQIMSALPLRVHAVFLSQSANPGLDFGNENSLIEAARAKITSEFDVAYKAKQEQFFDLFEKKFQLRERKHFEQPELEFAQVALSNLIGGIGYFYGDSLVDLSQEKNDVTAAESSSLSEEDVELEALLNDPSEKEDEQEKVAPPAKVEKANPTQLFTATPSRSFFPRGFFWDEGFHLLPLSVWDPNLTMDIIKSWFALMNDDGWIAREQILGDEARSKVPAEFQVQYPHYANPPTLLLPLIRLVESHKETMYQMDSLGFVDSKGTLIHDLEGLYPLIQRNFEWFRRTQRGQLFNQTTKDSQNAEEIYRWRGRTPNHCLTSGLDDFPRVNPPTSFELHVDLISWVGFYADCLSQLAEVLGKKKDVDYYEKIRSRISSNIQRYHWDEQSASFCDVYYDSEKKEYAAVGHQGYLALFPFLVGMVPHDKPHLKAVLELLQDSDRLFSDYGIRSLSKSDIFFGTGENYWKGPIWININFMVLRALNRYYASKPGPYQEMALDIYRRLRKNLIQNIYSEYQRTGTFWEQYSPIDGKGQRSHPFTGWTSLVINIMAEIY